MTRGCGPTDPTAAEYNIAIVNYRGLTRSDRALRVVQTNSGAIIFQRRHSRNRSGMTIANLHDGFEGAAVNARGYSAVAGVADPGSRMPVHTIDVELLANQVVGVANNDAICCRVEVDNVTRPERSARKSFALADGEELDAAVFGNEVSVDIINLAAMKFVFAEVRTQKRFVIISRYETNFLAIDLVGHFQA